MYSMKDAVVRNLEFMEENLRLKADVKRFAEINEQLIEDNEALKKKVHFYENTDLAKEHSHFVNECDLLREREAKLLKDNEVLQKEIAQMCERGAAYVSDNESLQAKLKHIEMVWRDQTKVMKADIDRLNKELDEERKQHSDVAAAAADYQCELNRLRAENEKLKKALDSACDSLGVCKESYTDFIQTLQSENNRLRTELIDERDRYDRLSDFELAEAKELERAKTMFNIAFSYLDQTGYDVEKLGVIVGLRLQLMERGLV